MKRKLARVVAILAVALGAGQLMQSMGGHGAKSEAVRSATAQKAKDVVTLAADPVPAVPVPAAPQNPALTPPRLPAATVANAPAAPPTPPAAVAPVVLADAAKPVAPAAPATPAPVVAADPCALKLDLANEANAVIGLSLVAPCHPSERVVLKHAGLAVTAKTTASGALFVNLPALEQNAKVEVLFKDGAKVESSVDMPEIAKIRRFAVQWQADDVFQIHAFEDDLGYGGPGDVSAASPHLPAVGTPAKGGFLSVLGDASTAEPLLAELYTYPADSNAKAEVVVEVPITAKSCGHEVLGDTISSIGGKVSVNDLSVAMTQCDALGGYLVLKNLVPDLNIAAN